MVVASRNKLLHRGHVKHETSGALGILTPPELYDAANFLTLSGILPAAASNSQILPTSLPCVTNINLHSPSLLRSCASCSPPIFLSRLRLFAFAVPPSPSTSASDRMPSRSYTYYRDSEVFLRQNCVRARCKLSRF